MAEPPKEGECYRSYEEFERYLKEFCDATSQTFVVHKSQKVETTNAYLPQKRCVVRGRKHRKKRFPVCLKYTFVKLTCVKYGDKKCKKCRPVTGARPTQR